MYPQWGITEISSTALLCEKRIYDGGMAELPSPLGDFRWYLLLAERENMSEVADELRLAQPTVSRMLARCERRLGVRLFDRHGKRITLNRYGRILYEHARRAQSELEAAAERIDSVARPPAGSLSLGFLHSFGTRLIPRMLLEFRAVAPEVDLLLTQGGADHLTGLVRSGSLDLAIVSPRPLTDPAGPPDLRWAPLSTEPLGLAVPAGHRLAQRREVEIAEVASDPYIVLHRGFGLRRISDELCAAAGFRPTIALEAGELATVAGFVAAGLGVGLLPMTADHVDHERVRVIALDPPAAREIGVVWSAVRPLLPAAERFRDHTVDVFPR